ncbi:MAG: hypothetical protein J2P15_22185 [Micromonosporaceae bacterium]|nr:hypothetical protein [Micromonosporaceae bacterium]
MLQSIRAVGPGRYEAVLLTGSGPYAVPYSVRPGSGVATCPAALPWPVGVDREAVTAAVLAFRDAAEAGQRSAARLAERHPLAKAGQAAQAGDQVTLRSTVDWPLSGLPALADGLARTDAANRPLLVAMTLAEFDAAGTEPRIGAEPLRQLAGVLVAARRVFHAAPEERHRVLRRLRPPPLPLDLDEAAYQAMRALAARAALVDEVYIVAGERGELPLALAPDTGRLVVLPPTDGLARR